MSSNPILNMVGIYKEFPGVKALSNVDFKLGTGEIHALMGENGAGKSTLIKSLTGVYKIEKGEIFLNGKKVEIDSPHEAQMLGISTVYQEVNLCPNLTVAENIFIGREPIKSFKIDWDEINKRAKTILSRLDINIDVTMTLDSYSIAIQQMVAIARALEISAKVLILDEPTSSLDTNEVNKLFEVMRKLREDGLGIIFVTHFLDQVYEVCDRITVLRNGQLVGEYEIEFLPRIELISKMIGKEFDSFESMKKSVSTMEKENSENSFIRLKGLGQKSTISSVDLNINKGEVIGLAGLLGSGRSEIARLIFGVDKADSGEIYIEGKKVTITSPGEAMTHQMAFCPEDRKVEGIIGDLTIRENIILAIQSQKGWFRYIGRKEQEEIANKYIKLLNIVTPSCEQKIENLSGGNQQKVILARWLVTEPELLILDEPTRGIDVGAKAEIQKLVLELAEEGMSIMFISSELEETVRCCNRVVVLCDRKIVGELSSEEISENKIMQIIAKEA